MDDCLTGEQITQYRNGTVGATGLRRADDHLRRCERCRGVLRAAVAGDTNSPTTGAAAVRLLGNPARRVPRACPESSELSSYATGAASPVDREILDAHLDTCALCREDVAELRQLRDEMAAFDWEAARAATGPRPRTGFVTTVLSLLFPPTDAPRRNLSWRVTMAAGALAVFVAAVLLATNLMLDSATTPLRERIARLEKEKANPTVATVSPIPSPSPGGRVNAPFEIAAQQRLRRRILALENQNRVAALERQVAEQKAQSATRKATALQERLAAMTRPATPSPREQPVLVTLRDNGRAVTLGADGRIFVEGKPLPAQDRFGNTVATALRTGKADIAPVAAELMRVATATALRGGSGLQTDGIPFALTAPLDVVVESSSPTFRWKPLGPDARYTVRVYDASYNEVASSDPRPLTATEWTPEAPLQRGGVYTWRVTARTDGREVISPTVPAPEARFRVLDVASAEQIRRFRADAAYRNSPLRLGLLYARLGLVSEAREQFARLVQDNPDSLTARRLLESVSPQSPSPISTNGAQ